MLITILTTGSRGDTQPYLALAVEIEKTGHHVRIAAFENYKDLVQSYGLEFFPIKGDISKVAARDDLKGALNADNPIKVLLSFNKLKSLVSDLQKEFYTACTGADAIIYHPGAAIGYFIAQQKKIPAILATPFPMTPTGNFPALIFYNNVRLGKGFNYLSHKIFEQIMWFASSSVVKQFWLKEFGKIPENYGCPFGRQITRKLPTIISCSKYVFPRPDDWPEHVYNNGYWLSDDAENWKPSPKLLKFLENGNPPIYIGFGSLGNSSKAIQTTELVVEALHLSGQRGILATGWNGLAEIANIPENILIIDSAPHSWLFPRMSAVVHHGGAGTTAAGLKAGIPSIVIPFSNDQFAWGRRVFELGVGPKPIPRKNLTADNLSMAIEFALSNETKKAAKDLGEKISSENGAAAAANVVLNSLI
jgi:sterol 3beta-glucosyltransferase